MAQIIWTGLIMKFTQTKPDSIELKKFGLIMGIALPTVFGLFIPFIWSYSLTVWPFIVGIFFILFAFFAPSFLWPFYFVWIFIGRVLGTFNYYVILSVIFIFIFTPVGLFFRIIKRDSMNRTFDRGRPSYRSPYNGSQKNNMEKPY